jgi:hypothetical protein
MKSPIKTRWVLLLFAVPVMALGASTTASAADNSTIRAGVLVNPVGTVATVEYEYLLGKKISLGARLGYIDYDYKDGTYRETGDGPGAELLLRFYPGGQGHKGFYVGGALGAWNSSWKWTDPNDTPTSDSGTSTAVDVNVNLGWKIPLGSDRIYIDPNIAIGNFFSTSSDDTANLGFYVAAGLSIGVTF